MPDPTIRRAGAFAAAVLTFVATAASGQQRGECDPAVRGLGPKHPDGFEVRLSRPCAPYGAVKVEYGPVFFDEELSVNGTLEVALPAIAGFSEVTFTWQSGEARLAVDPPSSAGTAFAVIAWPDGVAWANLSGTDGSEARRLGFPRPGAARIDIIGLGAGETPLLMAPVTPEVCGQMMQATLRAGPEFVPQSLSVRMPGCDAVGHTLRLPLGR